MVVGIVAVVVGVALFGLFVVLPTFLKSRNTRNDTHFADALIRYWESEVRRDAIPYSEAFNRFKQGIDDYSQPVVVYDND